MWFHQSSSSKLGRPDDEEEKLKPEDYEIYVNPKINAESEVWNLDLSPIQSKEYSWEYCGSFPGMRCMIKRPLGIQVSYINEDGDEREVELYDFKGN